MVRLRLEAPENQTGDKSKVRMLEITITDTGKGISTDYLRTSLYTRMFDPSTPMVIIVLINIAFSQEDVLANGTGLGLSIVRSIVSMLEGTIDIKSQVGQVSSFCSSSTVIPLDVGITLFVDGIRYLHCLSKSTPCMLTRNATAGY